MRYLLVSFTCAVLLALALSWQGGDEPAPEGPSAVGEEPAVPAGRIPLRAGTRETGSQEPMADATPPVPEKAAGPFSEASVSEEPARQGRGIPPRGSDRAAAREFESHVLDRIANDEYWDLSRAGEAERALEVYRRFTTVERREVLQTYDEAVSRYLRGLEQRLGREAARQELATRPVYRIDPRSLELVRIDGLPAIR